MNKTPPGESRRLLQHQYTTGFPQEAYDYFVPPLKTLPEVSTDATSANGTEHHIRKDYYHSIWVRTRTLCLVATLFAALAAALLTLWKEIQARNGIRPTWTSNHYTWTYGPTAVLVVVLSLWRQVDYHCKTLQPWQELYKGRSETSHSVMLDYVTPLHITSFVKAVRLGHWPVAASVTGFATMKLIILFSTSLLVLSPTTLEDAVPITLTTTFNGSRFWDSVSDPYDGGLWLNTNNAKGIAEGAYGTITPLPITKTIGLLQKERDSPGSVSAMDTLAFQSFQVPSSQKYAQTIWGNMDVFSPNITCEIATTNLDVITWEDRDILKPLELRSGTCLVDIPNGSLYPGHGQDNETVPQLWYGLWKANCSEKANNASTRNLLTSQTPDDIRHVFIVANATSKYRSNPNNENFPILVSRPHGSAVVVCGTDYFIEESHVSYDLATNSFFVDLPRRGERMPNLTATMLGEMIYSVADSTVGFQINPVTPDGLKPNIDPLIYTVVQAQDGEQLLANLLDVENLLHGAEKAYTNIATQLIQEGFLVPATDSAEGHTVYVEDRLHLALTSLWAMVAGFSVMIILSLCIVLTLAQGMVPYDPGAISSNAMILVHSSDLQEKLRFAGHLRTKQLKELLSGLRFSSYVDQRHSYQLRALGNLSPKTSGLAADTAGDAPWIPVPARLPMLGLTLAAPLLVIAALEVFFRISETRRGIADITGREDWAQYLAKYLSALVMLLVATCFNALDSTIASFAPYSILRSGNVPGNRSIRLNVLGELPVFALARSLKRLHFGLTFSSTASLIGSVLTIIASGLWMPDRNAAIEQFITASRLDNFNITWFNSSATGDAGAGVYTDKVMHGSVSMPSTTWEDFVLPGISDVRIDDSGPLDALATDLAHNVSVRVNALRPNLDCEVVADEYIEIEEDEDNRATRVKILAQMTGACQHGGPNGTNNYLNFSAFTQSPGSGSSGFSTKPVWRGAFRDIHLGPFYESINDEVQDGFGASGEKSEQNSIYPNDNPVGCPSIGVVFFKNVPRKSTAHEDMTVLVCSQQIQGVELDVNITHDGVRIIYPLVNVRTAPIADLESAIYLNNGSDGFDTFPYRVETYMNFSGFRHSDMYEQLDEFFDTLVYGPNGTSLDDLVGVGNRKTLIEAVQTLYNKYMSLVIDMKFRQPIPQGTPAEDRLVHGTMMTARSRLKVNETSKLILQILLGTMTAFGMAAIFLTDLRGTLPRDPCSIASTMAFLAGSDLCSKGGPLASLPKNASQKEIDKALEGHFFSLGWWDTDKDPVVEAETASSNFREGEKPNQRRFGVDIGVPAQLGFRETKWWRIRRRLLTRK